MRIIFIFHLFFGVLEGINFHKYTNQLVRCFNPKIKDFWSLQGGMSGGRFYPKLSNVNFIFYSDCMCDKVDAQKIAVDVIDYILFNYNSFDPIKLNMSNFPYTVENIEVYIHFINNTTPGSIKYVHSLKQYLFYQINTEDNSYNSIKETFDDAYFKLYGKKWDPFKYGDKCENDVESLQ